MNSGRGNIFITGAVEAQFSVRGAMPLPEGKPMTDPTAMKQTTDTIDSLIINPRWGGQGRQELPLMGYQDAFIIFPSREIVEKIIPQAVSLEILSSFTEEKAQAVRFHSQEISLPRTN